MIWFLIEAALLLVSIGVFVVALEIGYRLGLRRQVKTDEPDKTHANALHGATLGLLALLLGVGLSACGEEAGVASLPPPQEPGPGAVGYYCGMAVAEHPGPKGQVFLEGSAVPLFPPEPPASLLLRRGADRRSAEYETG